MLLNDIPIRRKLMRAIMLTSGVVLLLTCTAYFAYELLTFRQTSVKQLSTLGKIIAANCTAALAFDSREDAYETLSALRAEPHIVVAGLYDKEGKLFSHFPADYPIENLPSPNKKEDYHFEKSHIVGFQPVVQDTSPLGTLYLLSDMTAMNERLQLYGTIALLVVAGSFLVAYFLSRKLQESVSLPIVELAQTAQAISDRQDYSVRAKKLGNDEIGMLTDAFNQMLTRIQTQNHEIQTFNQKLEKSIVERTLELKAANQELESFSYSVSHDLRAPLRSIDGYSRVLLEDHSEHLTSEGKRVLGVIIKNAHRMGRLIDDLLDFSRLGKQNVTKINLDMHGMFSNVAEDLKSQQTKKVDINIKDILPAQGDSSMLKQVATNLISNAIKYSMKKENPVVEIGSYRQNDELVYYVKDNGAGFDMQYYDKLFGVFQRLHSANEFEGTGVGLALVHRIVTKHGGKIWAEGKVDEGATFYFSLPANHIN
jgi:signal transduction histidine kinase